jgi:hypothetical protein
MSDERTQVLSMLAEGKLTVEQARQLLDALSTSGEQRDKVVQPSEQPEDAFDPEIEPEDEEVDPELEASRKKVELISTLVMIKDGDFAYVRSLREYGLLANPSEGLIPLVAMGKDAAFIHDMQESGVLERVPLNVILRLVPKGLSAQEIQKYWDEGLRELLQEV